MGFSKDMKIKVKTEGDSNFFENTISLCFDCHVIVKQYDLKHL